MRRICENITNEVVTSGFLMKFNCFNTKKFDSLTTLQSILIENKNYFCLRNISK